MTGSIVTPAADTESAVTDHERTLAGSLSADDFKALFRGHPGGVAVITADAGHGPAALTLTSVASISAEPPLLHFSLSTLSSATPTILEAESFVVHLLDASDLEIAKLASTHGADRFPEGLWARLPTGEPYYPSVRNWLRCRDVDRLKAGASIVVVGLVLESSSPGEAVADPLVYHNRTWHRLGEHTRL